MWSPELCEITASVGNYHMFFCSWTGLSLTWMYQITKRVKRPFTARLGSRCVESRFQATQIGHPSLFQDLSSQSCSLFCECQEVVVVFVAVRLRLFELSSIRLCAPAVVEWNINGAPSNSFIAFNKSIGNHSATTTRASKISRRHEWYARFPSQQ